MKKNPPTSTLGVGAILQECCFESHARAHIVVTSRTIWTMFMFFVSAIKADVM